MDDLVSRKELLKSIEKVSVKGNVLDDDWVYRFVQEFPSIDAVQVIRCKDCKYKEAEEIGMVYCSIPIGGWVNEDWFCADGERKENG